MTPRMLAIALVLIGLDFLLRGRPIVSAALLLLGAALHPLMAFGGLLVWAGFFGWKCLGGRLFAAASAVIGSLATVVLACEPIALRCFGVMDDAWRQAIMHASSFNFPSEWGWEDWWYLTVQFAFAGAALWHYKDSLANAAGWCERGNPDRARFAAVVALVTIAGMVGSVLAERLPYALLLQGQPYRALWILAFLHLGWAFWLFVEWSKHSSQAVQLAGCAVLAYLTCTSGLLDETIFPMCVLPFAVLFLRGLERTPRNANWLPHSLQASLIIGGLGWMGYKYALLAGGWDRLIGRHMEARDIVEVLLGHVGPITITLLIAATLLLVGTNWRPARVWRLAAACLAWQVACFAFPETDFYAEHCTRYRADVQRMRDLVRAERRLDKSSSPLPTIYCNLGCLDYVWLDLHSKSYFDWWQAGGFMFRREMALEGQRRACLVAAFEIERFRKYEHELTDGDKQAVGRFFKTDFDKTHLSAADLARLSQEPKLDYILIEQEFDGLYAARHGRLFLYRCRDVRTAFGLPEPKHTSTFAAR